MKSAQPNDDASDLAWLPSTRPTIFVMTELAALRWHVDVATLSAALRGARKVRSVDEPHLSVGLARLAVCEAAIALFPVLGGRFVLSTRTGIDGALLAGAAIFGVGWGLAGYCPGPAIVDVASGSSSTLIFVAAMLVGSALTDRLVAPLFRRTSRPKSSDDPISTQGVPE